MVVACWCFPINTQRSPDPHQNHLHLPKRAMTSCITWQNEITIHSNLCLSCRRGGWPVWRFSFQPQNPPRRLSILQLNWGEDGGLSGFLLQWFSRTPVEDLLSDLKPVFSKSPEIKLQQMLLYNPLQVQNAQRHLTSAISCFWIFSCSVSSSCRSSKEMRQQRRLFLILTPQ